MNMELRVNPDSPVPAVRQIADQLRVFLVEGDLKPGDALPAVRRVAMELGVHFNTVAEAYRHLAEEGWLQLRHGRAAQVVAREATTPMATDRALFTTRLRGLLAEMRAKGLTPDELRAMTEEVL
jgi:GntR family transcriptional regulator